jgi:protoporphyrinogen oxidase
MSDFVTENIEKKSVAVIGAGPAGLTAAYLLAKRGVDVTVLESDPYYVGGISKTVKNDGFHFDIGGHRFFSKSKQVEDFWTEILPSDMLDRPRSSRVYYRKQFFQYPLKPFEALWKLGVFESILCVLSYFKAKLFPKKNPKSFQDWVTNQFGERLFRIFFKTYTEKVWGMSCKDISADWAAQRIKGLSLFSALKSAFLVKQSKSKDQVIKTLIDSFRYPRKGPGMLWETCAARVKEMGGTILMGQKATSLSWNKATKKWTLSTHSTTESTETATLVIDHVISSAPIRELIPSIQPPLPEKVVESAKALGYRDFITVTLALQGEELFDDNWIYIHDPSVKVGRIQNFKSWSPEMVPDPSYNCYGLEYFCFEGDGLWTKDDGELIDLAKSELNAIGLGNQSQFIKGYVVRQTKAYPVYDEHYLSRVETIRYQLEKDHPTLHLVGRNGMHKYNNQDHAIMTSMLTVQNILAGQRIYDVWEVNQDAEYHEAGARPSESSTSGLRSVPSRVAPKDAA